LCFNSTPAVFAAVQQLTAMNAEEREGAQRTSAAN
jgi:hypothetical protein